MLDQVAERTDPHKVFVILTGGEPLVREDLEVCGRAIYDRGFPWGMVTNGLFLTRDRLNRLRAAGLHTATVSLDGLEAEHNWMRGHRESFARALDAIRFLVDATDVIFDVVTCVNRRNIGQLEAIKQLLIDTGVKQWRVFTIFPSGRAAKDPALQLTGEEFRRLMEFIRTTRKEGRIHLSYGCEGFLGNYEGEVRDHLFFCNAGINTASFNNRYGTYGIGFAVPTKLVVYVMQEIIKHGRVIRGYLGISDDGATPLPGSDQVGVRVGYIDPYGPAAGSVQVGDLIVAVDGKGISNVRGLIDSISSTSPGTQMVFTVIRRGRQLEIPIVLAEDRPNVD